MFFTKEYSTFLCQEMLMHMKAKKKKCKGQASLSNCVQPIALVLQVKSSSHICNNFVVFFKKKAGRIVLLVLSLYLNQII